MAALPAARKEARPRGFQATVEGGKNCQKKKSAEKELGKIGGKRSRGQKFFGRSSHLSLSTRLFPSLFLFSLSRAD
jgi:hypothetical protein